jgi:hypothetical protein
MQPRAEALNVTGTPHFRQLGQQFCWRELESGWLNRRFEWIQSDHKPQPLGRLIDRKYIGFGVRFSF